MGIVSAQPQRCWCGTRNPYFAPIYGRCGGYGHIECICGGDFCVCHNHGDIECDGCQDCEEIDDRQDDDPREGCDCSACRQSRATW